VVWQGFQQDDAAVGEMYPGWINPWAVTNSGVLRMLGVEVDNNCGVGWRRKKLASRMILGIVVRDEQRGWIG